MLTSSLLIILPLIIFIKYRHWNMNNDSEEVSFISYLKRMETGLYIKISYSIC